MAFEEIVTMRLGETSSHRLLVRGSGASGTLDQMDVGFVWHVLFHLGWLRGWLDLEQDRSLGEGE